MLRAPSPRPLRAKSFFLSDDFPDSRAPATGPGSSPRLARMNGHADGSTGPGGLKIAPSITSALLRAKGPKGGPKVQPKPRVQTAPAFSKETKKTQTCPSQPRATSHSPVQPCLCALTSLPASDPVRVPVPHMSPRRQSIVSHPSFGCSVRTGRVCWRWTLSAFPSTASRTCTTRVRCDMGPRWPLPCFRLASGLSRERALW